MPSGTTGASSCPAAAFWNCETNPNSEWDLLKHSAIIYLLFPNTLIVWQGDHIETWRSFPRASRLKNALPKLHLFAEPATTDKAKRYWDKNMELLLATVEEEDFAVCIDIQRGFRANAQGYITFGRNEPGLTHYHHQMRSFLGLKEAAAING